VRAGIDASQRHRLAGVKEQVRILAGRAKIGQADGWVAADAAPSWPFKPATVICPRFEMTGG